MRTFAVTSLLLYALALHTSMAGMEIFGWILFLLGLLSVFVVKKNRAFNLPLLKPAAPYIGLCLLSIAITPSPEPFIKRIADLTWIFVFWGVAQTLILVWSDDFEKKLKILWIIALAAATLVGLYQFFSGYDFIRKTGDHLPQVGHYFRSTGFFSLCLTFAYSMGISGFTLALPSRRLHKALPYLALGLAGLCIYNSMTRGAWISFLGTIVLLGLIFFKKLTWRQIGVAVVSLMVYMLLLTKSDGGAKRIEHLTPTQTDQAVSERFDVWRGYLSMFQDHPVLGVGYDNGPAHLLEAYQKLGMDQDFVSHAHNDYLQALAETGIVGLLAFLFLLGSVFWKAYCLMPYRPDWAISLMAGQLYVSIGSLSQANFTDAEVNHFTIFNWALVSTLTWIYTRSSHSKGSETLS